MPHFLVTFSPYSSLQRMIIPSKFITHMKGKKSGLVSLIGPSEKAWHVSLVQEDHSLFLHDGWSEFVRHHGVECGDTLVFQYDGSKQFTVLIFDQTGCEKDSVFHANRSTPKRRGSEQGATLSETQCKKLKTRSLQCITNNEDVEVEKQCEDNCRDGKIVVAETCQELVLVPEPIEANLCSTKPEATLKKQRKSASDELRSRTGGSGSNYSARDEEKVFQSFVSPFPFFVRMMKRFNVHGSYTLKIPFEFSMSHFPNCKIKVVLSNVKGESWTVNSIPTTRVHTSHTICGGWMAFIRGNDIQEDDICIFELVRKFELRVNIMRDGREWLKRLNEKVDSNAITSGCGVTSHNNLEAPNKMPGNGPKIQLEHSDKVHNSDKEMSKSPKLSGLLKKTKKCASRSKGAGFPVSKRDCQPMKSASKEDIAARSFNSSFPNFVSIMKKFNTSGSYTLKVPHQFSLAHLPNSKTEIVLRNLKGECWTVNSCPAKTGHPVHTFCGGWMAFVRGNDVKTGNVCIFELVGKKEMLVHITRDREKATDSEKVIL